MILIYVKQSAIADPRLRANRLDLNQPPRPRGCETLVWKSAHEARAICRDMNKLTESEIGTLTRPWTTSKKQMRDLR